MTKNIRLANLIKIKFYRIKIKNKYFLSLFTFIFVMFIALQKIDHTVAGMPAVGRTWDQVVEALPITILISVIGSFLLNRMIYAYNSNNRKALLTAKMKILNIEKNSSDPNTYECRVCGFYEEEYPWGEDGKSPTYQICPCCGIQFGKEDITLEEIKKYRNDWVAKGCKWFVKGEKPEKWNVEIQMKNIPEKFK